ncbi:hypothetical protein BH11PLA2_BH11PLA2_09400 [soil metagenome]
MILPGTQSPTLADGRLARWLFPTPSPQARFQQMLERGEFEPAGIFVSMSDNETLNGALVTSDLGGLQVDIGPTHTENNEIAEALLQAAVTAWQARGIKQFQCLVKPSESNRVLARVGFRNVTSLNFYERDITAADADLLPPRLQLREVIDDEQSFADLLLNTFVDSLDVPELNGTRTAMETLAGYKTGSTVDPPIWFFVTLDGNDVGVLILNPHSPTNFELTYMGLVPSARRQGHGRELAGIAVALTASFGGTRLHLSADARNSSADRVYSQLGFHVVEQRAVWLLI